MTCDLISLDVLLQRQWNATPWPVNDVLAAADGRRNQESFLRRWIPEPIIRRVVRGFARSSTVHPDTAQALYSIVRAMKPKCVFETGTYWGYSTTYLAAALADNGGGKVWSFDLYARAGGHIPRALLPWIELHRGAAATSAMPPVLKSVVPEIFFQDSVHDYEGVLSELRTIVPHLPKHAVVLFHDFAVDPVRCAARDGLPGYRIYQLAGNDPQQLGVALKGVSPHY